MARRLWICGIVGIVCAVSLLQAQDKRIVVHRKTTRLELITDGKRVFECRVRVGKPKTMTPLGTGVVAEKRSHPIFRYVDPGPKQGQVIYEAECAQGLIHVNYKNMRALALRFDSLSLPEKFMRRKGIKKSGEDRYSIHSTSCTETIGHAVSNGCIGLSIPDMRTLFDLVQGDAKSSHPTRFEIQDD